MALIFLSPHFAQSDEEVIDTFLDSLDSIKDIGNGWFRIQSKRHKLPRKDQEVILNLAFQMVGDQEIFLFVRYFLADTFDEEISYLLDTFENIE